MVEWKGKAERWKGGKVESGKAERRKGNNRQRISVAVWPKQDV